MQLEAIIEFIIIILLICFGVIFVLSGIFLKIKEIKDKKEFEMIKSNYQKKKQFVNKVYIYGEELDDNF